MNIPVHSLSEMDPESVSTAALQGFFSITEHWGLTARQQRTLLGDPPESTFFKWESTRSAKRLDSGALERISYILGIHKALRALLPNERAVFDWVKKPNTAPLFKGGSALTRMLAGSASDLYEVRKYLDGERG